MQRGGDDGRASGVITERGKHLDESFAPIGQRKHAEYIKDAHLFGDG